MPNKKHDHTVVRYALGLIQSSHKSITTQTGLLKVLNWIWSAGYSAGRASKQKFLKQQELDFDEG